MTFDKTRLVEKTNRSQDDGTDKTNERKRKNNYFA